MEENGFAGRSDSMKPEKDLLSNVTHATKTNDTPHLVSFPEVFLMKKSAPDMMWESRSYVDRVCQDTLHNKEIHKQNGVTIISKHKSQNTVLFITNS